MNYHAELCLLFHVCSLLIIIRWIIARRPHHTRMKCMSLQCIVYTCVYVAALARTCSCNVAFFLVCWTMSRTHWCSSTFDPKEVLVQMEKPTIFFPIFAFVISILVHVHSYTCSMYSDWNTKRPFFSQIVFSFSAFLTCLRACVCILLCKPMHTNVYLSSIYCVCILLPYPRANIVISFTIWFTVSCFYWVVKNKNATCFCIH